MTIDRMAGLVAHLRELSAVLDGKDEYDPDEWICDAAILMEAAANAIVQLRATVETLGGRV